MLTTERTIRAKPSMPLAEDNVCITLAQAGSICAEQDKLRVIAMRHCINLCSNVCVRGYRISRLQGGCRGKMCSRRGLTRHSLSLWVGCERHTHPLEAPGR